MKHQLFTALLVSLAGITSASPALSTFYIVGAKQGSNVVDIMNADGTLHHSVTIPGYSGFADVVAIPSTKRIGLVANSTPVLVEFDLASNKIFATHPLPIVCKCLSPITSNLYVLYGDINDNSKSLGFLYSAALNRAYGVLNLPANGALGGAIYATDKNVYGVSAANSIAVYSSTGGSPLYLGAPCQGLDSNYTSKPVQMGNYIYVLKRDSGNISGTQLLRFKPGAKPQYDATFKIGTSGWRFSNYLIAMPDGVTMVSVVHEPSASPNTAMGVWNTTTQQTTRTISPWAYDAICGYRS